MARVSKTFAPRAEPGSHRLGRSGSAAVEMALVMPLIITVLSGLWEAGRIVDVQRALYSAAREGARQAATGQFTDAQVQTIALNHFKLYLGDTTGTLTANATATCADLTVPGTDASSASSLDQLQVTITVPFKDVRWIKLPLITNDSTTLTGQVTWVTMTDAAYPTTLPQPPQG